MLNDVCDLGGFPRLSSVINSTDATARQLLAIANERGAEATRMFDFPQLTKASSLTLAATETQPLPADLAELLDETAWYTGDMTPLTGPITFQQWQAITQTLVAPTKFAFRVTQTTSAGRGLSFTPTPTGGEVISIFYRTKSWVKPRDWSAGMAVTGGSYAFANGDYWTANSSGTTGSNPPTIANSGNDGNIIWTRRPGVLYQTFLADTDEPLIESTVLMKGILARFYRMKGLEYQDLEAEYYSSLRNDLAERNGGRTSNLFRGMGRFLSEANIKEGNWS